jgi:hypothetical protein
MKDNYIIERFEEYLAFQSQNLNEAQSDKTGFLAILGSTDNQNLGASAAPKIGIKPDTIYTLTIKGEADLMSIGKNRTYEGFAGLKEGGKSKPQADFISINSGGKMLEIKSAPKAKGNIIADFDKSGVIEIKDKMNTIKGISFSGGYLYATLTNSVVKIEVSNPSNMTTVVSSGLDTPFELGVDAGKIYVANFFFTICPSICPTMTKNLLVVQNTFKNDPDILMLSHSVMPTTDTVAQLKKYANRWKIDSQRWHLLSGKKDKIYSFL